MDLSESATSPLLRGQTTAPAGHTYSMLASVQDLTLKKTGKMPKENYSE